MKPADKQLLVGMCDPACELENCIIGQLPESWKAKGCKGDVSVGVFVNRTQRSQRQARKLRDKQKAVSATLNIRIETDTCNTTDCAAGIVEQCLCEMFDGRSSCCCADLTWIDTDRSIDSKNNKEIRLMRFAAELLPREKNGE